MEITMVTRIQNWHVECNTKEKWKHRKNI